MISNIITALLLFVWIASCSPISDLHKPEAATELPLPVRTVAQIDTAPAWLENIAVRANGDLLVTQLAPAPVLFTVKNPSFKNATLDPIYQFNVPNASTLLGITETYPDTFAIIAGNATPNADGYPGTFSVWSAKFPSPQTSKLEIRKIANVPAAKFLNGVITLPERTEILIIPDSQYGLLFRLDTRTGRSEVIADRPEFKPYPERQNKTVGFGINGVRIRDGYLYFSNSNLVKIFRVRLTRDGYVGQAPVEVYADLNAATTFVDDFTFAGDGTLWAVSNDGNTVVVVGPGGKKVREVAGASDALTIAGGTAGAFGRGAGDREVLYVCTAGGLDAPVNGTVVEAGKIVAIDTRGYGYSESDIYGLV
ncbi:hypothetical protein CC86DRAFT_456431 [Ophiobolus disseminans]|uniref:SMP-30/Gluconolactonase/LRE-like region domain-containing protein n=1 Tax=Ophiobolus disseminans TaxID=1469910 RepID=A0A6A6ZVU3_9PLEO|nr:hypothetical protein CC86DRAFT_456431 [Ophiobolus disseminans]